MTLDQMRDIITNDQLKNPVKVCHMLGWIKKNTTLKEAKEIFGITQEQILSVLFKKKPHKEVKARCMKGEISLHTAWQINRLPATEQVQWLKVASDGFEDFRDKITERLKVLKSWRKA